jgi:hypothetical protein
VVLIYHIELHLKLAHMRQRMSQGPEAGAHRAVLVRLPQGRQLVEMSRTLLRGGLAFVALYTYSMYTLGPWLHPHACAAG